MADRSFFVRLNLDDMADSLDALDSTEERGLWLEGFRVGSRGKAGRDGWTEAKALGHSFGLSCWETAQDYREKQSAKGKASVEARRKRTELEPELNHGSTTVQPRIEPEVNLSNNQYPITNNQETNSEEPKAKSKGGKPQVRFAPSMFDEIIPDSLIYSEQFLATWHDWVTDRYARKKPITEMAAKAQLDSLAPLGPIQAIQCTRASIANGWQGLFPERFQQQNKPGKPQWTGFAQTDYSPSERRGPNGETLI
jgi:hypothetical protein